MTSAFDEVLPREKLSTAKWEMEFARTGNPNLLCFGTADMDFRSPRAVVDALRATVEQGHFGYPYRPDSYYDAITSMLCSHGWDVDRSCIASNVGIYQSMQTLIEELTQPGDEVVYQTPVHHIFAELIEANDRVPLENPLVETSGEFRMDLAGLADTVSTRTRLLLLCNPHNPVGRVWTREELTALDEFCRSRGIIVVSDEVYFGLVHEGASYVPFASVSREASLNSVTLTGASKSFNLSGLKHSLVVSENPEFLAAYNKGLRRNILFYGGSSLGIVATEAAFADGADWTRDLMTYIAHNRAVLAESIERVVPQARIFDADGTYFAWVDLRALGLDDSALVRFFEDANLIITPGHMLGTGGSGHVRWNLACPTSVLQAGLARFETAISTLANRR
jgi:cystathionine beta-lyase